MTFANPNQAIAQRRNNVLAIIEVVGFVLSIIIVGPVLVAGPA